MPIGPFYLVPSFSSEPLGGVFRGLDGGALLNTGADGDRIGASENERRCAILSVGVSKSSIELMVTERRRCDLTLGVMAISFNGDLPAFLTRRRDRGLIDSLERGEDVGDEFVELVELGEAGDMRLGGGISLTFTFKAAA